MSAEAQKRRNSEECASCGVRRDRHNTATSCPRFVRPTVYETKPRDIGWAVDWGAVTVNQIPWTAVTIPASTAAGGSLDIQVRAMADRIAALEKQLQNQNWNPRVERAMRERTDYTQVFSEDEDGLEADYRGWPKPKKRTVF